MRTLFLTVEPAWPPVTAADFRNWHNARAAVALGPVLLVALTGRREGDPDIPGVASVSLTASSPDVVWAGADRDALAEPILVPEGVETRLAEILRVYAPDRIVLEGLSLHPLLPVFAGDTGRIVVDFHHIDSGLHHDAARTLPLFRFGARRQAQAAARASAETERRATAAASAWVRSDLEAQRLRRTAPEADITVVPDGIPRPDIAPGALMPSPMRPGDETRLLFLADFASHQDEDAAGWLAREILPAARKRVGALRLMIASRRLPAAQAQWAESGAVECVTLEHDPEAVFAAADIALLPVRAGHARPVEALAVVSRGVPLIASARAVEGLRFIVGEHYRRAETTRDFARAAVELARNAEWRDRLRAAAWQHCLRHFGPAATARAVQRALSGKAGPH